MQTPSIWFTYPLPDVHACTCTPPLYRWEIMAWREGMGHHALSTTQQGGRLGLRSIVAYMAWRWGVAHFISTALFNLSTSFCLGLDYVSFTERKTEARQVELPRPGHTECLWESCSQAQAQQPGQATSLRDLQPHYWSEGAVVAWVVDPEGAGPSSWLPWSPGLRPSPSLVLHPSRLPCVAVGS